LGKDEAGEKGNRADCQELTASSREEFFKDCKSGGKYDGIVGIYRHNDSASTVGVFDKEFIEGLPESVKYICHNGAGYDQSESSPFLRLTASFPSDHHILPER
jgi:glyoxylate reductase